MTAIRRFLRPVAWQNAPAAVLPPELRDENPLGIWRRVDGELTRDPVASCNVMKSGMRHTSIASARLRRRRACPAFRVLAS